jgi:hypothetical protein
MTDGYYWVYWVDEWTIAELHDGTWYLAGDDRMYGESDFKVIREKIERND